MPMCSELFFGDLSWQSVRYEYNALRIGTIVRVLRVLSPGGWLLRVVRLRGGQGSRLKAQGTQRRSQPCNRKTC
jgi:hypothetical protein